MYEAYTAVVGTVITNPVKRETASGDEVLSFRMASNARRQDRTTGEWVDGGTLYLTVSCWRKLVVGVAATIMRGDPIIAYGQVRTNEYRTKEGVERSDLEMRASAVGPDLARCQAKLVRRGNVSTPDSGGAAAATAAPAGSATEVASIDASQPGAEPVAV